MPAPLRRHSLSLDRNLKGSLLPQVAGYLLVFRLCDGFATWFLVLQARIGIGSALGWFNALMLAYLAANVALYSRYREGRASSPVLAFDLAINLGTVAVAAGLTGGLPSPVVLIFLCKIVGYGFVFSPTMGLYAVVGTAGVFTALVGGQAFNLWRIVPLSAPPAAVKFFFGFVLTVLLLGSVWLFYQFRDRERRIRVEMHRARAAAEKERRARSVASALVTVSEAISRLTRIDAILDTVAEVAPRLLPMDYCFLFVWREQENRYECRAASGIAPARARQMLGLQVTPAEETDLEWVRRLGHGAVIAARHKGATALTPPSFLLASPLLSGGQFYGIILFARGGSRNTFTQNDLRVADGIAGQTAVALERARLVEQGQRLAQAVESMGEGLLITDREQNITFANPALLKMLGYEAEELIGRNSAFFGEDLSEELVAEIRRTVLNGIWRGETLARRKDGSTFPTSTHVSLIRGDRNTIQGTVIIVEDITEKRALQERLHRADRLAAVGEFGAGVAHEVNNALVGLLGQVEAARSSADASATNNAVDAIERQAQRIAGIVQDMLGFARPQPPQRRAFDMRKLVDDTVALVAHKLARSNVRFEVLGADDLPAALADARQVQQVLVNLFKNARQAMKAQGGGVLTVRMDAQTGYIRVRVQDTGPGIPTQDLPRIFDPFYSTKKSGSGLGLSVSYAIIAAQGGELTVESTVGEGSTFTLTLPLVLGDADIQLRTALVVDDERAVAETLRDMLEDEGLSVRTARTGEQALDILRERAFDVVCLDLRLPDVSGDELYARLAREQPNQAHRVIFVTGGLWRGEDQALRSQLPPQPVVRKPCTAADLREALRQLGSRPAAAA